eukprot:CAMPEP_0195009610 /NCGR_PEP_ID=MMETSP0326_2-20130528/9447_1 /TAXON_ID=2866 ORGANISM="Crypthecodinium cohnii, Strain Seligo" /NCGR_SAMPLE_ID=MMETSP0326_2 /ASSEMBLY_ACC=CAM_ASM_000348 /LENGTH=41 /DNA_ID= /DNA_START= /DNA_END= /DNA_ORIENTATION=
MFDDVDVVDDDDDDDDDDEDDDVGPYPPSIVMDCLRILRGV